MMLVKVSKAELNIQLDADAVSLNEVRVAWYNGYRSAKETAGSVSLITARDINRGSARVFSIGVEWYPRCTDGPEHAFEARISIRGNGVRASYGIRNVKVYLNEIPVTEADGTTRMKHWMSTVLVGLR